MKEHVEIRLRISQRKCKRLENEVVKIRDDFENYKKIAAQDVISAQYSYTLRENMLKDEIRSLKEELSERRTHPDDASEYRIYMQDRLDERDFIVNRFHFSYHPWVNSLANVKAGQGTVEDRFVLQESH